MPNGQGRYKDIAIQTLKIYCHSQPFPKKISDSNKTSLSGGRWCVDKNFTHLELTDGMQAQLLTDLRDNRFCKSPLLGDSVGFVNFTENLQDAQYRAGGKSN